MEEQALQLVGKETTNAVLHQIDTDLNKIYFRFTDKAATKEISVLVPVDNIPLEQWVIEINLHTPLVGTTDPGLNLRRLRVGPGRVIQTLLAHWRGCVPRGLTLYNEKGNPTWLADCTTSEGAVSVTIDGETGIFHPSNISSVLPPVTATSLR